MNELIWFAAAVLAVLLAMAGGHAGHHITRNQQQGEEA